MNKADLYKRSNPNRQLDFGGFVDYYNALEDGTVYPKNGEKIQKKRINLSPRAEKLSFTSGR